MYTTCAYSMPSISDRVFYNPQTLGELTKGEAIITTGVGQHQMWAAQWYPYTEPRRWISSGGLGSMGFGLPAALGAAAAFDGKNGRPSRVVVDIDGDGSFLMNVQVGQVHCVCGLCVFTSVDAQAYGREHCYDDARVYTVYGAK